VSDSDDETKLLQGHVDRELLEAADFAWGEKTPWLERMLKHRVFGEPYVTADTKNELTDTHLDTVQSARASYRQQIEQCSVNGMIRVEDALAAEAESFIPALHALARERHERESDAMGEYEQKQTEKVEEAWAELDAEVQAGCRLFPGHGKVRNIVNLTRKTPEEVIEEVRERNPDASASQFPYTDGPGVATDGGGSA